MESTPLTAQIYSVLAVVALGLMVVVTGGIVYLTAAEWRDRRRQKLDQEPPRRRPKRS